MKKGKIALILSILALIVAFFLAPAKPYFGIETIVEWEPATSEFLTYVNGKIVGECSYSENGKVVYTIQPNASLIRIMTMKKYEGSEGILKIAFPWQVKTQSPFDSDNMQRYGL